ncbi:anchored repeat-type ABC transporter ATP-binding subunit [Buchananella felis]|uniref:anchored repeat-type ABC transporter ATP-binding subunit n=1 Tax=Buchananella felis TaxID=3231492 RepID=UPI003527D8A4
MHQPGKAATLEVSGLAVDLGGRRVLTDVNLDVRCGELTALIGPNGAGKTTLLRSVLGLQAAAEGSVRVEGKRVSPGKVAIGYVPQRHEFAWDFPLSVAQVVLTGLTGKLGWLRRARAEHWQAVYEALERVQMDHLATRPVGQLSGGQRQRVLVARALALAPALLLLDEPFTGLDMPTQELLSALFVELAHEGRAVLMTTHDLLGAMDSADRVILLNRTVVADAPPAQLAQNAGAWVETFGVSQDSALVRMMKVALK